MGQWIAVRCHGIRTNLSQYRHQYRHQYEYAYRRQYRHRHRQRGLMHI